ncbi:MAG: PilW family protein [Pseudomonadota bacterium]
MSRLNRQSVRQARGFGLIELMIALLLGIVVMGGVAQVFYSTSQSYRAQQALSRVQESGRFAIEILKPRLRPAGRTNFCVARLQTNEVLDNGAPGYEAAIYNPNLPVVGFEFNGTDLDDNYALPATLGTGAVNAGDYSTAFGALAIPQAAVDNAVPGSDVLIIKYAEPVDQVTACGYDAASADLNLNFPVDCGTTPAAPYSQTELDELFPRGGLVMVTDCNTGGDLFQRTNDGSAAFSLNDGGTTPGNLGAGLSRSYNDEAQVLPFHSIMFFIGVNAGGQPALFQMDYGTDATPEEIIEGVENMQLLFGELDGLGNVTYLEPHLVTTPANIVSMRVSLLLRSTNNADLETDDQTYNLNGTTVDPVDDSRLRQVFFTTVAVRNRVNVI